MKTFNLDDIKLEKGAHELDGKFCVMELAAYLAHEPWSDHPKCVSPVIGAFLRSWNDSLNDDDRQMLKPYAPKVLHTAGSADLETKRAWIATDWLVRECAPAFLRLAGLTEHAETLEKLAALTGAREAESAQPLITAARDAAWAAARAAAWDAALAAAGAALAPTVKLLQDSALQMLDRMIDLKDSIESDSSAAVIAARIE